MSIEVPAGESNGYRIIYHRQVDIEKIRRKRSYCQNRTSLPGRMCVFAYISFFLLVGAWSGDQVLVFRARALSVTVSSHISTPIMRFLAAIYIALISSWAVSKGAISCSKNSRKEFQQNIVVYCSFCLCMCFKWEEVLQVIKVNINSSFHVYQA